jgi:hypothetical protein
VNRTKSLHEKKLTAKARNSLSASDFVFPKDRRYPIADLAHARAALSRCSGTKDEAKVRAAVHRRYPQLKKKKVQDSVILSTERLLREDDEPLPPSEPGVNPELGREPDPGTVDLLDELPDDEVNDSPVNDTQQFKGLKELARKDRPTLEHLLKLKKLYQETGELNGKQAQLSMQSILIRLFRYDESEAMRFGRIEWQADEVAFVGLMDQIGQEKLGPYLGMTTVADVPKGPIADAEGELPGSEVEMEEPEIPGRPPEKPERRTESISFMHLLD